MRKTKGSYRIYSIPGKTAALVPEFAVEDLPSAEPTCLRQNCSLGFCACSEGPALGQNTLMMIAVILLKSCGYAVTEVSFNKHKEPFLLFLIIILNSNQLIYH